MTKKKGAGRGKVVMTWQVKIFREQDNAMK
jgi:hypothetical protein